VTGPSISTHLSLGFLHTLPESSTCASTLCDNNAGRGIHLSRSMLHLRGRPRGDELGYVLAKPAHHGRHGKACGLLRTFAEIPSIPSTLQIMHEFRLATTFLKRPSRNSRVFRRIVDRMSRSLGILPGLPAPWYFIRIEGRNGFPQLLKKGLARVLPS